MRTNAANKQKTEKTHEGAPAWKLDAYSQLRRSVLASLLWENTFYESGEDHAARVKNLVPKVEKDLVAGLALTARNQMYLRHIPLLLVRELARIKGNGTLVADTLEEVIQRPDELMEYLSIYWSGDDKDKPLSAGSKRGLSRAIKKFNAYSLGKYKQADKAIKLRDVLRIVHPTPKSAEQSTDFKKLLEGTLEAPDTWEVALSAGADKKETFERLLKENKLGELAFLRNLRNMIQSGVDKSLIRERFKGNFDKVLPFRFFAALAYAEPFRDQLEEAMLRAASSLEKMPGKTIILVDNSSSMYSALSAKSDLQRIDAACGLAVLIREICEESEVIGFGSIAAKVKNYRGFALADAIKRGPGGGTDTRAGVQLANNSGYDRLIIITDEQSHTAIGNPHGKGYVINVASYQNGIGYGPWVNITGWSENVVRFIQALEAEGGQT